MLFGRIGVLARFPLSDKVVLINTNINYMFENNAQYNFVTQRNEINRKKAIIKTEKTIEYLMEHPDRYKNTDKMLSLFMRKLDLL